jgi:protein ImuA
LIWVRECRCEDGGGQLYAPGLAELGATLNYLVIVTAPDALAVLRAGADIVSSRAAGTLVLEPWRRAPAFDHTASRRLALASARTA